MPVLQEQKTGPRLSLASGLNMQLPRLLPFYWDGAYREIK